MNKLPDRPAALVADMAVGRAIRQNPTLVAAVPQLHDELRRQLGAFGSWTDYTFKDDANAALWAYADGIQARAGTDGDLAHIKDRFPEGVLEYVAKLAMAIRAVDTQAPGMADPYILLAHVQKAIRVVDTVLTAATGFGG